MSFFFFKQKTAYEMRISDWSSDVCSSDLTTSGSGQKKPPERANFTCICGSCAAYPPLRDCLESGALAAGIHILPAGTTGLSQQSLCQSDPVSLRDRPRSPLGGERSEEHTSELQSLMRISYAVFCLKN